MFSRPPVLLAFFLALAATGHAQQPKNVLFLAADDLRNDLGCYGNREVITPHLDALADRGIVFDRAYCQQAVCNPSRASLLTGMRPDTLRIWNLATHFRERFPDVVTLPGHFKAEGYHCEGIGKIFHNWRQKIEGDPASWSVGEVEHYATHGSDTPEVDFEIPGDSATAPQCRFYDIDLPDEAFRDGRIAALTIAALRRCAEQADRPFFLAAGFWKPHAPFNAPKKYWDLYEREKISLAPHPEAPENVPPIALHDGREIRREAQGGVITPAQSREIRHGYYANISYLDAQIGKVIDELDRLEIGDNTLIVFWSDHGYHLGEHSLWAKTSNFELDARVPLIIADPGNAHPGSRSGTPVELLDLYPTIAELCGLDLPDHLEGTSLAPVMADPDHASAKPAAFTQHPRPAYPKGDPEAMGISARTADLRYTEWRDFGSGEVIARELYDHRIDPHETQNLIEQFSDQPALAEIESLLLTQFPRRGY